MLLRDGRAALEPVEYRHYHGAARRLVRLKRRICDTLHKTLFVNILNAVVEPVFFCYICESS